MTKGYMIITETPFQLIYRLFVPDTKKSVDLICLHSAAIGATIENKGGMNEFDNLNDAVYKDDEEKKIHSYYNEVQLTQEDLDCINGIETAFSRRDGDSFFSETKTLMAKVYGQIDDPDDIKKARLKLDFGVGEIE